MGRLAKRGVKVVLHNTLASSDYGLLDQDTFTPRPNYWAAWLWRRLMRTRVLDAGSARPGLHLYARCLRGHLGGVTILAINTSHTRPASIHLPKSADRYTLTAPRLEATYAQLNGRTLKLGAEDALPSLRGRHVPAGRETLTPESITFLAITDARNGQRRFSGEPAKMAAGMSRRRATSQPTQAKNA